MDNTILSQSKKFE